MRVWEISTWPVGLMDKASASGAPEPEIPGSSPGRVIHALFLVPCVGFHKVHIFLDLLMGFILLSLSCRVNV